MIKKSSASLSYIHVGYRLGTGTAFTGVDVQWRDSTINKKTPFKFLINSFPINYDVSTKEKNLIYYDVSIGLPKKKPDKLWRRYDYDFKLSGQY